MQFWKVPTQFKAPDLILADLHNIRTLYFADTDLEKL